MSDYDFDLFVIGGGSGGVRAARAAAAQGMKVGIAEAGQWGGTCVNLGCVPKKFFVYAADFADQFETGAAYGWSLQAPEFNWSTLLRNKDRQISRLNSIYLDLLKTNGVEIFESYARIVGNKEVTVAGATYSAERILIAVGSKPYVPEYPGIEHVITSDQIFHLESLPRRVAVVGGGYIACEFASILNGLGCEVTQIYRGELPLRGFDVECRRFLADHLVRHGIDLRLNTDVSSIEKTISGLLMHLNSGEKEVDLILYATGRKPHTAGLWGEDVNIDTGEQGEILVDQNFQTSVDSIFAIGDVIDRVALTPVAIEEAMQLVDYWTQGKPVDLDYANIPSAVFTLPSLACVGRTEEEVLASGIKAKIYTSDVRSLKNTLTEKKDRVLLKLIVESETDRVLGVHMVGDDAADVIQGMAVAVNMGATKADFDRTVGIHPSIAEEFVTLRSVDREINT